jgi:hypothetical protein
MKSAYELAMERLEKASPSMSPHRRSEEGNRRSRFCLSGENCRERSLLERSNSQGANRWNSEEAQSLEKQLASEVRRLQDECEAKKEKLRKSFIKS